MNDLWEAIITISAINKIARPHLIRGRDKYIKNASGRAAGAPGGAGVVDALGRPRGQGRLPPTGRAAQLQEPVLVRWGRRRPRQPAHLVALQQHHRDAHPRRQRPMYTPKPLKLSTLVLICVVLQPSWATTNRASRPSGPSTDNWTTTPTATSTCPSRTRYEINPWQIRVQMGRGNFSRPSCGFPFSNKGCNFSTPKDNNLIIEGNFLSQ